MTTPLRILALACEDDTLADAAQFQLDRLEAIENAAGVIVNLYLLYGDTEIPHSAIRELVKAIRKEENT